MKSTLSILALLLLAACSDDAATGSGAPETGGELSGDVLEGTVSDEMIALDQLTSTSPPAQAEARTGSDNGTAGEASEPSEGGETEAVAEDAD